MIPLLLAPLLSWSNPVVPRYEAGQVPPDLAAWAPWVRAEHPELDCAFAAQGAVCRWPRRLQVDAGTSEGTFELDVTLDTPGAVTLPGGAGAWPQGVTVGGRPAAVLANDGRPTVFLPRGTSSLRGRMPWTTRPASLAVPSDVGVLAVRVDGIPLARPGLDSDGRLRLTEGDAGGAADSRLEIDVSRRIDDGVPVIVTTRIDLRASGTPRELDLGAVALPGTRPVQLTSDVPARFGADGHLLVLVRPGSWSVQFEARHDGPVSGLTAPTLAAPWPEAEYWTWKPDDRARAATPSGPPGIDPSRTPVPEEWRSLATFRVTPAEPLRIEELRRGEPDPAPNEIRLSRELWLDLDGGGWTVRDRFEGAQRRDWRLDTLAPLTLGHVSDRGEDQVITTRAGGPTGVEVRNSALDVRAESRVEDRPGVLPAVGWAHDVEQLNARVHLPPGWSLLAAFGVDSTQDGALVDRWTLWDLFFVLVVGLASWRVLGWRWGLVTFAGLTLARHDPDAPAWIWPALLAVVALARAVPWDWARIAGRWTTWTGMIVLALWMVPWGVYSVQTGIWPSLSEPNQDATLATVTDEYLSVARSADSSVWSGENEYNQDEGAKRKSEKKLSLQVDPGAKVQTGPGIPTWTFREVALTWNGPVTADQEMRLLLLSPWQNALLAVLRVALFIALGLGFVGAARRLPAPEPPATSKDGTASLQGTATATGAAVVAVLLSLGLLFSPTPARAQDPAVPNALTEPVTPRSPDLLDALRARLLAPPACRPACVTAGSAQILVNGTTLTVRASVSAGEAASWPVPGPATSWVPARVTIDGQTADLARLSDGHLHVRVAAGTHEILAEGPLPPGDSVTLSWGLPPQRLDWQAEGWSLEGRKADGSADAFAQLTRVVAGGGPEGQRAEELAPWLEVERYLDLGVPWRVETTVRRVGPALQPLALRIPLLPGESVTEAGYEGDGASRLVTLARDQTEASWTSTLQTTPTLTLTAPAEPWTEIWRISCSPVFACRMNGPPPISHVDEDRWGPMWRPWPGETLTLEVERPQGVEGATTTLDSVTLTWTPGRRQTRGELVFQARSSQGGVRVVTLPPGARLTGASVDSAPQPLQLRSDGTVHVPLVPGKQTVQLTFIDDTPAGWWFQAPPVGLGGPAVNVRTIVSAPDQRWVIALFGPSWGPVPLYIVYVVLVLLGAVLLRRIPGSPLATWQWALLGLGMTQVPVVVPLIVAGWLVAFAWRGRTWPKNPWLFNLMQLGLLGWTVVALGCMYAAVHAGLLFDPDMQIQGNGSTAWTFNWYVDRVEAEAPRPAAFSAPVWVWRVLMLAWALWAAWSVIVWIRRAFVAFGQGGYVRVDLEELLPTPKRKVKPAPEPTSPAASPEAVDPG